MIQKLITHLVTAGILFPTLACGITGLEVAQAVDERITPKDIRTELKMVLTNKKGKTRTNEMLSLARDDNSKQMIWFLSPKDDEGVAFLKIEHDDKDDEMRLWLPAFKKVRRISAKAKSESFMGSDLSYEDLTSRELDEYDYELKGEEVINDNACYILESTPKKDTDTDYSRHVEWITKDTFLPIKGESWDRKGRLLKIRTIEYQQLSDYHVLNRLFVRDVQSEHSTELLFTRVQVDIGIEPDQFAEKNLKRLPRN